MTDTNPDGPLVAADEWFSHQIVETQAYVAQADRSWTEKVCAMAAARDGSLQVGFGVGKYTNRNVFDGYASVSRGREQWTVRASRRLADAPDLLGAGPLGYAIVEPMKRIRFSCLPEDGQRLPVPIAFDFTFDAVAAPVLESRHRGRARGGLPARHRPAALPPVGARRGLGRPRRRTHRDHRRYLVLHA